jgi:hypothetical protein
MPVAPAYTINLQEQSMPYYIYAIQQGPTALVKHLDQLEEFEKFKDAKNRARELRAATAPDDTRVIKVIFADSALEAEEKLQEHREAPILKEWEK